MRRFLCVAAALCILLLTGCTGVERTPVPGNVLGLMYHDLTADEANTSAWTTTPEKFSADLTALFEAGYQPLSLEDYAKGDYSAEENYFVVTFDDGYTSNLTLALPILEALHVPASVFVITELTGTDGYMTWDQLRELTASGVVTVYSHTETHLKASESTKEAFLADEHTAWAKIEENLSPSMKALSYPHGAFTRETMDALTAEGYAVFTVQDVPEWYVEDNKAGARILFRYNVGYEDDVTELCELNRTRAAAANGGK